MCDKLNTSNTSEEITVSVGVDHAPIIIEVPDQLEIARYMSIKDSLDQAINNDDNLIYEAIVRSANRDQNPVTDEAHQPQDSVPQIIESDVFIRALENIRAEQALLKPERESIESTLEDKIKKDIELLLSGNENLMNTESESLNVAKNEISLSGNTDLEHTNE